MKAILDICKWETCKVVEDKNHVMVSFAIGVLTAHLRNGSLHYEITVVIHFRVDDEQIICCTEVSLYAVSFQIVTTIESTFAIWWRMNLKQRLGCNGFVDRREKCRNSDDWWEG